MDNTKRSSAEGMGFDQSKEESSKEQSKKSDKKKWMNKTTTTSDGREVLLRLPGGFEYKAPGKKQRVILGSVVVGLNMLLLIAVGLYFYVPVFKDFIYNLGR